MGDFGICRYQNCLLCVYRLTAAKGGISLQDRISKKIIFDTDLGGDCDDTGAAADAEIVAAIDPLML